MASKNERQRWSEWFDKVSVRMASQKDSISRLVLITTETTAALYEIAALDPDDKEGYNKARDRAQEALDRVGAPAAAAVSAAEELRDEENPTDPRRKNHE